MVPALAGDSGGQTAPALGEFIVESTGAPEPFEP